MYFSRVSLDERIEPTEVVLRSLESEYGLHQAIWRIFSDDPARRRDFLYHVENRPGPPAVLTLSARPPQASGSGWRVETKPYEPKLATGSRFSFLLRANPVRTREGQRHDVVMDEKRRMRQSMAANQGLPNEAELVQSTCTGWLTRRADGHGFRVLSARADAYRQVELRRSRSAPIRFSTVDITGALEVVDPATFLTKALAEGIGPAKGFGCGLLLLRRG
ncbi:MAG: type I-E CRISPR-associated protein Cas6/Cse3/CasE [Thermoanaerobaculia bacterium]